MSLYYSDFILGVDTTDYETDDGETMRLFTRWKHSYVMEMDHDTSTIYSACKHTIFQHKYTIYQ